MLGDYKSGILELKDRTQKYLDYMDVIEKQKEIANLEEISKSSDFWDDTNNANKIIKKINNLKKRVDPWILFKREVDDLAVLFEMALEENSLEYEDEIASICQKLKEEIDQLEFYGSIR